MIVSLAVLLSFEIAKKSDAAELAALHTAVSEHLTREFGPGRRTSTTTVRGVLADMRLPKFSKTLIARRGRRIIAALRLHTKKPWAIDTAYFTPAKRPLYLTGMAVHPDLQRAGVGRLMLEKAAAIAREWPADVIRLDSFAAAAGAGAFYAKCGYREVARVKYKGNPLVYYEMMLAG